MNKPNSPTGKRLTKSQSDLLKWMGYVGSVEQCSPAVLKIGEDFATPSTISTIVNRIKTLADLESKASDEELMESCNFSETGGNRFDPQDRQQVLAQTKAGIFRAKMANAQDVKRMLGLICCGMQLAYEKYGKLTVPKAIVVSSNAGVTHMAYSPTKQVARSLGAKPSQDALEDGIIINPDCFYTTYIDNALHNLRQDEALEGHKLTPHEQLMRGGFEESYHAWQVKDQKKFSEMLEAISRLSAEEKGFVGKLPGAKHTRELNDAIHQTSPLEIDAKQSIAEHVDDIKTRANAITSRARF